MILVENLNYFELGASEFLEEMKNLEAAKKATKASLEVAKKLLEKAKTSYSKVLKKFEKSKVSQEEVLKAEKELEAATTLLEELKKEKVPKAKVMPAQGIKNLVKKSLEIVDDFDNYLRRISRPRVFRDANDATHIANLWKHNCHQIHLGSITPEQGFKSYPAFSDLMWRRTKGTQSFILSKSQDLLNREFEKAKRLKVTLDMTNYEEYNIYKKNLPLVQLSHEDSSKSHYTTLAYDYDGQDPEALKLIEGLSRHATIIPTPSGKKKALFFLWVEKGIDLTRSRKESILREIIREIEPDLLDAEDPSYGGLSKLFLTEESWNILKFACPPTIFIVSKTYIGYEAPQPEKSKHKWNFVPHNEDLKALIRSRLRKIVACDWFGRIAKSKARKKSPKELEIARRSEDRLVNGLYTVLRFMLSMQDKALEGMQLPGCYIADQSGMDRIKVYEYIQRLVDLGALQLTNASYSYGYAPAGRPGKAKTYKVTRWAADFFKSVKIAHPKFENQKRAIPPDLQRIEDGEWNSKLLKLTNYFKDWESYLAHIQSLEGSSLKDRWKKAIEAWNAHVRIDGHVKALCPYN